jgi:Kef-type K+ transport system membrane component KefB
MLGLLISSAGTTTIAVDLVIVLVAALAGRILSKRLRQPVVFGEILAGMVLGALQGSGIQLIQGSDVLAALGQIGILILLFSAGLATSLEELKGLGRPSIVAALSGVAVPFLLGYLASVAFGYSNLVALLVGTGLVATSVGVNAEILSELRLLRTRIGTLVMGTALADDVIGIIMLSVMISFVTTGHVPVLDTLLTLALTALFFGICLFVGVKAIAKLSQRLELGRYDLLLTGIVLAVAVGVVAESIGLAMIVGGFLAGLMLGQSRYGARLIQQSTLVGEGFFVPIFFVTTGMAFRPESVLNAGGFAATILAVAVVGKIVGCSLPVKGIGFTGRESLVVGIAMVPRAGVELVLIRIGMDAGVFGSDIVSSLLLMVIVTTMITPPLLSYSLRRFGIGGPGEDAVERRKVVA